MRVNVSSGGKAMEDVPCTFDEAMYLVEHQDTFHKDKENYISFYTDQQPDSSIQFIREEEDRWIIDIPAFEDDEYIGSFNSIANHSQTVALVTHFYLKESVLRQSIIGQDYASLEKEMGKTWGLGIHLVEYSD